MIALYSDISLSFSEYVSDHVLEDGFHSGLLKVAFEVFPKDCDVGGFTFDETLDEPPIKD